MATEHQLLAEHRRRVVSSVAGGLAHYFNNVLGGLLGVISLVPNMDAAPWGTLAGKATGQIEEASRLIRVVLGLARGQQGEVSARCDATRRARDVIALARTCLVGSNTLSARFPEGELWVATSGIAFDQMLLGLVVAAVEAPAGQAARVQATLEPRGDFAWLTVESNNGLDFDAWELTETAVHAIADRASGSVSVSVETGEAMRVVVRLPRVAV